jgi:CheY-like chemotaxis protein
VNGNARPGLRVLYVEDDRVNALLFEEMLRLTDGLEAELRVAEDAAQALALARQWQPQVLVIDAHVPDAHGIEVLRRLRAVPGLEAVPAFMCSADALPEDRQAALAAGFAGYWTKPIDIHHVGAELRSLWR